MFWPRANSHSLKVKTEREVAKIVENKHQAFRVAQSTYGPQNLSKLVFYCLKLTFYRTQTPHSATHV